MDARRQSIENDEPRHKKKSKKKGRPRADHKHEYKTVLLLNEYENRYFPGKPMLYKRPTKVCMICGRIGDIDLSQYEVTDLPDIKYRIREYTIRDEDSLEKWYVDDYFDKFAKKMEDT